MIFFFKKAFKRRSHCVKNVRIWRFSGPHFPAFGLTTERYSVFSSNSWKEGLEKLRIRPLFMQWKLKHVFGIPNYKQLVLLHYTAIYVLVWSREGCKTLPGNVTGTGRCGCAHLTNFALLLDEDQSETTRQLL